MRNYVAPQIEVVEMKIESDILQVSGGTGESVTPEGDFAREFDAWDEW